MTIERKLLSTSPSDDAPDVAEAFSTHLYTGVGGSAQTINNGIDLLGEGGLVWTKHRDTALGSAPHLLVDTERGANKSLRTNDTSAEESALTVNSFTSTGYILANDVGPQGGTRYNTANYVSWTFRKKEKFFDVVTYTGNGVAGRTVAHNLGSVPGMMIIRNLAQGYSWQVYHRSMANTERIELDNQGAKSTGQTTYWNSTTPTSSVFTLGTQNQVNEDGDSFVAYLFADNSSEDAEEQMIKCGSYTGTGSAGLAVNLGWEPQFVIIKNASSSTEWMMQDTMRGMSHYGWRYLLANDNSVESGAADAARVAPTPTGFTVNNNGSNAFGQSGNSVIYMAIRAPMMKEPEAATDVFGISNAMTQPLPAFNSTFPVDMSLNKRPAYGQNISIGSRLQGTKHLYTDTIGAEVNEVEYVWDFMDGWGGFNSSNSDYRSWNWKRAKGFFDVVAYTGNATVRTIPHSLGVVPEMMWFKADTNDHWKTMTDTGSITSIMDLNRDGDSGSSIAYFFGNNSTYTAPTDSVFTIGTQGNVNLNNTKVVAYLFATLAGISKVGNYTGNGSSQTINCGFSAGSRFVLIKRTNAEGSTSNWYIWDSVRGIVSGNDPHLSLNTNAAQVTNDDSIDPHNSGFIVNQVSATNINVSSGTYIFYAIA